MTRSSTPPATSSTGNSAGTTSTAGARGGGGAGPGERGSILRQPRAVWAVGFACVIAFMGIGLVDPILPAISAQLGATPAQTMLLFTSYLLVTGLAMFFTSFVSSRIGAKRT